LTKVKILHLNLFTPMHTDLFIRTLAFIAPLSESLQQQFARMIVREKHPKKTFLLKEGQTAKKIYFINEGFARAFYQTPDGRECTSWFMGGGDFMISVYSFFTQQPAAENIELLEDTDLLSMTWAQLQSIYADYPEFNFTGRIITQKYYMESEERNILLRTLTARERYERLLQTHPQILKHASLGQVASYLGITQETLSRVRGKP
jgi:CRP-like cAMP-binding protein